LEAGLIITSMFRTIRLGPLNMTQEQFSKASGIPVRTVVRMDADVPVHPSTVELAARAMLKMRVGPRLVKAFLKSQQHTCKRCSAIDDITREVLPEALL
jgi:hypothetical protein